MRSTCTTSVTANRGQDCGLSVGNGPGQIGPVMVENVKEELNAPGEWFYDKTACELMYYPPPQVWTSPPRWSETAEQDQLITINGESSAHPAHDITFSGFHFTGDPPDALRQHVHRRWARATGRSCARARST